MKKTFVMALCLIGTATTTSAQFKIHSNGKLSFKRTLTTAPSSPISLGNGTVVEDSTYFVTYKGNKNGMYISTEGNSTANGAGTRYGGYFRCYTSNAETLVGLRSYTGFSSIENSSNPGCVGVWGSCFPWSTNRYGYGVLGHATGDFYSAGVCGISSMSSVSDAVPDDKYAGLFVGKTKVVGTLLTVSSVADVSLGNAALSTPGGNELVAERGGSVTDMMLELNARSFRHAPAVKSSEAKPTFLDPSEEEKEELTKMGADISKLNEVEEDVFTRQIQDKQHYGLSADELEKVFPDLVYEDKDGSKKINYVEMVPLLVQCINELNARLSAMDGGDVGAGPVPARKARTAETSIDGTTAKAQAVLYQNTPNPFTAQTEIRFSLPADAPQAYIYIFDMTGKMQKQIPVDAQMQSVTINGYELQAGIYLYSLVVGGQEIDTKRMILSK